MLTKFKKRVYNSLKKIPKGKVTTYKILAQKIGEAKNWRLVGKILSQNLEWKEIPCYKVVRSDGRIGGYSQGINKKKNLLQKEGIVIKNYKIQNFNSYLFKNF